MINLTSKEWTKLINNLVLWEGCLCQYHVLVNGAISYGLNFNCKFWCISGAAAVVDLFPSFLPSPLLLSFMGHGDGSQHTDIQFQYFENTILLTITFWMQMYHMTYDLSPALLQNPCLLPLLWLLLLLPTYTLPPSTKSVLCTCICNYNVGQSS